MNFETDYQKLQEQQKNKQEQKSLNSLEKKLSDQGLDTPEAIKEFAKQRQENQQSSEGKSDKCLVTQTQESLQDWRAKRQDNQQSSEGKSDDDSNRKLNLDPPSPTPTKEDQEIQKQSEHLESNLKIAEQEINSSQQELEKAQTDYQQASDNIIREESKNLPDKNALNQSLNQWRELRDRSQEKSKEATNKLSQAESNSKELRQKIQEFKKPTRRF
jgi:hypothetical protein